jgi:hypothetical protein
MTQEEQQQFVRSRYPDAYMRKYAALSMVIWCPMLDCRLSGFFHTAEEAWADSVEWIKRQDEQKKLNRLKHGR